MNMDWQEGKVLRYQALSELYKNYGFMKDNKEFVATYISTLEEEEKILKAMQEIDKDLQNQTGKLENSDYKADTFNNTVSFTLKNNTKYTYSTDVKASIYDKNKNLIEQLTDYKEDIKPNTKFKITFYCKDISNISSLNWTMYPYNIKFNK